MDEDQLADYRERLTADRDELQKMGDEYPLRGESRATLLGKAQGLALAIDYLRAYDR